MGNTASPALSVAAIEVPSLGNRCHLVHDGEVGLVVDPPRDLGAVERAAEAAEVEIVAVADTHVHNDYVSGGPRLARRHGADHLLSAEEAVAFERVGVRGGDRLAYGALEVEVLDTPGHTAHHQSFVARAGDTSVLLSGGSLLHGTVGRTDLLDPDSPALARRLARAQWDSARAQGRLRPDTLLLPTHGFGSFCAGAAVDRGEHEGPVTVGDQHAVNPALRLDREPFAAELVAGFGPIPGHYEHMDPLNRRGAGLAPVRPARPVDGATLVDAVAAGAWVVDLRSRRDFALGHLPGSVSVEYSPQLATYVGWLVPWPGRDVVLVADAEAADRLADAVRDLAGIGIEGVRTHVLAPARPLTGRYRRAGWADYLDADAGADRMVLVDVRQREEWRGGHLPGAVHLPVQDVGHRGRDLPPGELWVHCRSGYRAGIAASVLHRAGRDVVHVDDAWERVAELGLATVPAAA
ncbi:rhodanese-like domain-containing protein [Nocardioides marinquilinus]